MITRIGNYRQWLSDIGNTEGVSSFQEAYKKTTQNNPDIHLVQTQSLTERQTHA
tara:strand:- start:3379 stop:3540 length:162 start_codon:yes stop_codon:yes gene_type:complete